MKRIACTPQESPIERSHAAAHIGNGGTGLAVLSSAKTPRVAIGQESNFPLFMRLYGVGVSTRESVMIRDLLLDSFIFCAFCVTCFVVYSL